MSCDFFCAVEMSVWMQTIKDIKDSKKSCLNKEKHKTEGEKVLKVKKLLLGFELEKLLLWHGVQNSILETKMQKSPSGLK